MSKTPAKSLKFLAPRPGLEPGTCGLTVRRSGAKVPYRPAKSGVLEGRIRHWVQVRRPKCQEGV